MDYPITDTSRKPKSFAVKTIMKNDSLMKTISEGLKSAPGSTKRTKAAKLLRSLNKSGGNFFASDGMGGGEEASQFNPFSFDRAKANVVGQSMQPQQVSQPAPFDTRVPEEIDYSKVEPQQEIDYSTRTEFVPSVDSLLNPDPISAETDQSSVDSNLSGATPLPSSVGATESPSDNDEDGFGSSSLLDLRRSGLGPTGLTTAAMVNPGILIDFGLPKSVADGFPRESLEEQKLAIRNTLLKQFGIEEREDQLVKKYEQGGNIVSDLTNYLAETDSYFKSIDGLYNDTLERAANMDTSNPNVAKRVNNYTNYLKILRNKQNDRNVSFITMAGNQVEDEIKALESVFNIQMNKFNRESKSQNDLATELHDKSFKTIEELEDNLDERIKLEDQRQSLLNQGIEFSADTFNDLTTMGIMTTMASNLKSQGKTFAEIDFAIKDYLDANDMSYAVHELSTAYAQAGVEEPKDTSKTGDAEADIARVEEFMNSEEAQQMTDIELKDALLDLVKLENLSTIAVGDVNSKVASRPTANFLTKEFILKEFDKADLEDAAINAGATKKGERKNWYSKKEQLADIDAFIESMVNEFYYYRTEQKKTDADILKMLKEKGLAKGYGEILSASSK